MRVPNIDSNQSQAEAGASAQWRDAAPLRRGLTCSLRVSGISCAAAGIALLATGVAAPVGGLLLAVSLGLGAGSVFSPKMGERVFDFPGADQPAGSATLGQPPANYYQPNYQDNQNALFEEPGEH